jgi:dihydrofolate reductase
MGRLVVHNHITLDGVMQGPGRADEDPRGGFTHGGWAAADGDEVMGKVIGEAMGRGGAMLFGRRTYEQLYDFWPKQSDDNPFTPALNEARKYVASTTLKEPLPWENSTLLSDDIPGAVQRVKDQLDKELVVLGSGHLIQTLMQHGLVDEFLLMIHPLVLGSGRLLFPEGMPTTRLHVAESVTTTTGVLIGRYTT